jgi:3'-phosphoadenosine 5'-phosphosulfate (PAPS) 3'-phosphatase
MADGSAPANVIERVAELIVDVSASVIEPRFAATTEADAREKSPGELVTDADEEGERLLTAGLEALWPGVPVVGEERCSSDPTLVDAMRQEWAWLVDPVDGTANFIAGSSQWAVMVSLQHLSETVMSWIWQPGASPHVPGGARRRRDVQRRAADERSASR